MAKLRKRGGDRREETGDRQEGSDRRDSLFKFHRVGVLSCKNNILFGATLPQLLGILIRNRKYVEWFKYGVRICCLLMFAIFNTILSVLESIRHKFAISQVQLNDEPIFVIGHPRTGTTLVHNVLSSDARFSFATNLQVGFPSTFILMSNFQWLLSFFVDKKRPMDNMELSLDLPGEDEIATTLLSGGCSAYMPLFFMSQYKTYLDLLNLNTTKERLDTWTASFLFFLKKITYWNDRSLAKQSAHRRLIIKSPVHTSRIPTLLRLFPKAKFIFCYRDPYTVVQSAVHMAQSYYWYTYLNEPSDADISDFVLDQMEIIYREYFKHRNLIPKGNLVEIKFEEMENDIIKTMESIYDQFSLGDIKNLTESAMFKKYREGMTDFKKNSLSRLNEEQKEAVKKRFAFIFETLNYQM
ncbi:hypothetical protein GUITHDRAFT_165242 [Guillardia theta CCMP2712]|uniref:Sulfotransferase n=1 Tax=Guillardia theta (strain CCMP2712) TaxID=905079 RepID=L1IQ77_GUITC|nr:hypothetical protein GUITHDRAFT_165242 [Guillardia theta CCMP2712]EKX38398.1 hypothetical protein GUITHDRAFT_165242 [Guillardia theta CCMP2712]|eukprot:XP_005825378.1 hypothetical protein GUITHDRAFT_165242 [Guillardia theta CCMP2712]